MERLRKRHDRNLLLFDPPEIAIDVSKSSLQRRILVFLHREGAIDSPEEYINRAHKSARSAAKERARMSRLGIKCRREIAAASRMPFDPADQYICKQAAIDGKFSAPYTVGDFARLIVASFRGGKGEDLMNLLAALKTASSRRTKSKKFAPLRISLSRLWVDPDCPLWLFRSQIIAGVLKNIFSPGGQFRNKRSIVQ